MPSPRQASTHDVPSLCEASTASLLDEWVGGIDTRDGGSEGIEDGVGHGCGGREMLLICLSICRASLAVETAHKMKTNFLRVSLLCDIVARSFNAFY